MQKWSAENPELLAHAGLSAAYGADGVGDASSHFIAGGMNVDKIGLLKLAGVDPTKHVHPQSGHPLKENGGHKKKKGKKGKGNKGNNHLTFTVGNNPPITVSTGNTNNSKHSHKKKNPFIGADLAKLKAVYARALSNYYNVVTTEITTVRQISSKFPDIIKRDFASALEAAKTFYNSAKTDSHASNTQLYETAFEILSSTLTNYKGKDTAQYKLKYDIRKPHKIPDQRINGSVSLLSKLINITIAFIRTHMKDEESRKGVGMYELRQELFKMANAKENCIEIKQAIDSAEFKQNTNQSGASVRPFGSTHIVRESAEHAFDHHDAFSMGQPYGL